MPVKVSIVGGGANKPPVSYPDGSNTKAVKEDLFIGYGQGILHKNGFGVISDTLEPGYYEFHLTSPQGVGSRLRQVRMKDRIFGHAESGGSDLSAVLASELKYKIVVTQAKFVESHGDTFELGECEYGVAVDSLLEHILVGNVGTSEMTTVSRNADFLKIFDISCGYRVYRDHVDPSSIVRRRSDDTGVYRGCACFKNVAKANISEEDAARKELTDKLSPDALRVFPANSQSIFGMTSFPQLINIYNIGFNSTSNMFHTTLLCSFDMRHLEQRVCFIRAVFKIAEWISTVPGAREELLHLVPGVRTRTPNGHHVTWTKDCLLKELKLRATAKTRDEEDDARMRHTMQRIGEIYTARLPNVEWGAIELPNLLKVSRIGFMLNCAMLKGMITREKALADVRKG
eukprot:gene28569-34487_t